MSNPIRASGTPKAAKQPSVRRRSKGDWRKKIPQNRTYAFHVTAAKQIAKLRPKPKSRLKIGCYLMVDLWKTPEIDGGKDWRAEYWSGRGKHGGVVTGIAEPIDVVSGARK